MKRFLVLVGLVMAATVVMCSCSNSKSKQSEDLDALPMVKKTTSAGNVIVSIEGVDVEVPAETAKKFTARAINCALDRYKFLKENDVLPKDASEFGNKKFIINWKAVDRNFNQEGIVSVVHYEKGVEVIKDGKSWFYDFAQTTVGDVDQREYFAMEAVMRPGVWEPVLVQIDENRDFFISYLYTGQEGNYEFCFIKEDVYKSKGISSIDDLRADE